jgi:hypothetical protein
MNYCTIELRIQETIAVGASFHPVQRQWAKMMGQIEKLGGVTESLDCYGNLLEILRETTNEDRAVSDLA